MAAQPPLEAWSVRPSGSGFDQAHRLVQRYALRFKQRDQERGNRSDNLVASDKIGRTVICRAKTTPAEQLSGFLARTCEHG